MYGNGDFFMRGRYFFDNYVPPFGHGIFTAPNYYPPPRYPFPGFDIPPFPPRYTHPFPVTPSSVMLMPNLMIPIQPGLTVGMNPHQHTLFCQSLFRLHQMQGYLPPPPAHVVVLPPVQFSCPCSILHPTYDGPSSHQYASNEIPTPNANTSHRQNERVNRTENPTESQSKSDNQTENTNAEVKSPDNNERPAQNSETPKPAFVNRYIPLQEFPFDHPSPAYGHPGFISFPGFEPYYGNGLLPTPYSYSNPYEYIAYGYSYAQQNTSNIFHSNIFHSNTFYSSTRYRRRPYYRSPRSPPTPLTLRPESPGRKRFGPHLSRLEQFRQTQVKKEVKKEETVVEAKTTTIENEISTVERNIPAVKETFAAVLGKSKLVATTVEEKSIAVVEKTTDVPCTTVVPLESQKIEEEPIKDLTPEISSEEIMSNQPLTYAQILSGKKAKPTKAQRCPQPTTKIEQPKEKIKSQIKEDHVCPPQQSMHLEQPPASSSVTAHPVRMTYAQILKGASNVTEPTPAKPEWVHSKDYWKGSPVKTGKPLAGNPQPDIFKKQNKPKKTDKQPETVVLYSQSEKWTSSSSSLSSSNMAPTIIEMSKQRDANATLLKPEDSI